MTREMERASSGELTDCPARLERGDRTAVDLLRLHVYDDRRRMADGILRHDRPGRTLQPTARVHEARARLVGSGSPGREGERHFLAVAAKAMRQLLADQAERRGTEKRGGAARVEPRLEAWIAEHGLAAAAGRLGAEPGWSAREREVAAPCLAGRKAPGVPATGSTRQERRPRGRRPEGLARSRGQLRTRAGGGYALCPGAPVAQGPETRRVTGVVAAALGWEERSQRPFGRLLRGERREVP